MENTAAGLTADGAPESEKLHVGAQSMPAWDVGELPAAPRFTSRSILLLIGPGLLAGAAAIGGGEWLTGPLVSAKYGGALFWLATLSILSQVLYNIEISRYALYCGEPIFTGKFRIVPGPILWVPVYLLLDFGSFLPYLASNAAIPLFAIINQRLPNPAEDTIGLNILATLCLVLGLTPLLFGGKVYNSLKAVMTFKLVVVIGFLSFLAIFYSTSDTWVEILSGFINFGGLPIQAEKGEPVTQNYLWAMFNGDALRPIDMSMIGIIAAMAAVSGNGGLTNTPISNYTRDQGWGMGGQVGAIPSFFGKHSIRLSHVGRVFRLHTESLARWAGWYWHVAREQLMVWMPACFIGIALPSMLSIQFLPRGLELNDKWLAAGMTADGVAKAVGDFWGPLFWYLTLFCGFLVLVTAMIATSDGVMRRWVDVFWTASKRMRQMGPTEIGRVYFTVLCVFVTIGTIMIWFVPGDQLLKLSTNIYNYALGFSCFHVLLINTILLPKPIRPNYFIRAGLIAAGTFFIVIAVLTNIELIMKMK